MAIDKKLIGQLLTDYKKPEDIIGENGLLKELTKSVLELASVALPNKRAEMANLWAENRLFGQVDETA